jgi:hypothetical protein
MDRIVWCKMVCLAVVSGAASACGEGDNVGSEARWAVVVDTVADTITVRTLSGSVWGDTVTLTPEVSIGVLDGADEYIIGEPRALTVAPDGTILLLDSQLPVLRMYSSDGTHLRDVGRAGNGPGEYESPDGLAALSDGRILVRDPANQRITVYGPDGAYLDEWRLGGGFSTNRRFYVDNADQSYVTALMEPGVAPWEWTFGLVRYSADGEILDTLLTPTWDYEYPRVTASSEGSSSMRRVPFTPQTEWGFSPLGVMVGGLSTDYRIDFYRSDGSVLRMERDWESVPVLPDEAEERRRRITMGLQRQYGAWRWNGPDVPDMKPPFKGIFTTDEGNVWVHRHTASLPVMTAAEARREEEMSGRPALRFEEPPAFDVFDPEGRFLGHVRVPEAFTVEPEPVVRGDYVWAVTRDELDVASIVRFRLTTPQ